MQNIQTIDMNNSLICKCPSVKGLGPDAQLRPLYPVSSARLHNHGNNDNTIHRGCDPYIRPRPRRPLQSLASPGLRDSGVFFSREGWILSGRVWNPYVPSQSSVWILYVDDCDSEWPEGEIDTRTSHPWAGLFGHIWTPYVLVMYGWFTWMTFRSEWPCVQSPSGPCRDPARPSQMHGSYTLLEF